MNDDTLWNLRKVQCFALHLKSNLLRTAVRRSLGTARALPRRRTKSFLPRRSLPRCGAKCGEQKTPAIRRGQGVRGASPPKPFAPQRGEQKTQAKRRSLATFCSAPRCGAKNFILKKAFCSAKKKVKKCLSS